MYKNTNQIMLRISKLLLNKYSGFFVKRLNKIKIEIFLITKTKIKIKALHHNIRNNNIIKLKIMNKKKEKMIINKNKATQMIKQMKKNMKYTKMTQLSINDTLMINFMIIIILSILLSFFILKSSINQ